MKPIDYILTIALLSTLYFGLIVFLCVIAGISALFQLNDFFTPKYNEF